MKNIKLLFIGVLTFVFSNLIIAQAPPQGINYQAVAYDTKNIELPGKDLEAMPLVNQEISIRFTIIESAANGNSMYAEEHMTETDENGLFNLVIGTGSPLDTISFSSIDWASGLHFLKVELNTGKEFKEMGIQQFWSVPYALYTEKAGNGIKDIINNGNSVTFNFENGVSETINISSSPSGTGINWLGTYTSAPNSPALNDAYYNSVLGISYIWDGSAWQTLAKDGTDGANGANGIDGVDGIGVVWLGSFAVAPSTPVLNQAYYNSADGISYIWDGSAWQIIAKDGTGGGGGLGITWLGSSATPPPTPSINQAYYNSTDGISYIWDGAIWQIVSQDGSNGTNGTGIDWLGTQASAPSNPTLNQAYYNSTDGISYIWNGTTWQIIAQDGTGSGGGNTLNQAYNEGGAGIGRTIVANDGAVEINLTSAAVDNKALVVTSNQNNTFAIDAENTGTGVAIRAKSSNASNTFAALQAESNSSDANNSTIIGVNTGAGYSISGQIPGTGTGIAAVFGSNLQTTTGHGVMGEGYNGVWGESKSNDGNGFGVVGINQSPNGYAIGTYGLGFHGVFGETLDPGIGWAGYFTDDIGVEGEGISLLGWSTASDRRLKSNIIPISNALERVSRLSGNTYTLKTKHSDLKGNISFKETVQYGVIAQEVEAEFPEIITEKAIFRNAGDDTKYKTVNYDELVPVLIEAIKELKNKVETLEQEVETLRNN